MDFPDITGSVRVSLRKQLLAAVILLVMLSVAFEPQIHAATKVTTGQPSQLSLSVIPPKLPADGKTYSAVVVSLEDSGGRASVAFAAVTVYLSSSSQNVATVSNPIVIPQGHLYAIANLTTTVTPGTTAITASSAGLQTAIASVTTATPSGFPSSLKVFLAPNATISEPSYRGLVTVELLDQKGLPARAGNNTLVQLSSSDTNVANVSQNSLMIHTGDIMASGNFVTAYIPGQASVIAVASGLLSGSAAATVIGSSPLFLKVFAQPTKIGLKSIGRLTLGLTDKSGNPATTPADLVISVTSNNTAVAYAGLVSKPGKSFNVTIYAGSSFAVTNYTTTKIPGTANFTFSESGLNPAYALVSSVAAATTPNEFQVLVGPTRVLADQQGYSAAVVSLLYCKAGVLIAKCSPANSTIPITVQLTSSDTQVGTVPSNVTIQPGKGFAAFTFTSTYLAERTIITAFANGFQTGQASILTVGPVPAQLRLAGLPGTLPADGNSYKALEVYLEDSSGGPAFASSNTQVQLLSSESDVVSLDSSVTILNGSYFAVANLTTTLLPGSANITAFAASLSPALIVVKTQVPAPSQVATYISPAKSLLTGVSLNPILVVQLQDSSGNPARARVDTLAIVTSSNSSVLKTPIPLIIKKGQDYASTTLDVLSSGSATLTTESSGLATSSATMNVASLVPTLTLTPSYASIYSNSKATLQLTVVVEGMPVQGARVSWNSTTGSVSPNVTVTNSKGVTSTIFDPPSPNSHGYANIWASISSPDFGTASALFGAAYTVQPVKTPPTLAQTILSYMIYIIPVLAVVVAVALFITLRRRRQRAREELEAGFQTMS